MQRKKLFLILIPLSFLVSFSAKILFSPAPVRSSGKSDQNQSQPHRLRIVSLAPSITETLFALGLGPHVVGVTRYCEYPPETRTIPRIGGMTDPNLEAVAALHPNLMIILSQQLDKKGQYEQLGIDVVAVNHDTIAGILDSMLIIGRRCGRLKQAREHVRQIRKRLDHIRKLTQGRTVPRVMICIGRAMGTGSIRKVYLAGPHTFYHECLTFAGARNAYCGSIPYPPVDREGILRLDPDIIIEIIPNLEKKGILPEVILKQWRQLDLRAVHNGKVYLLTESFAAIPGPRFILILERMVKLIHPELGNTGINPHAD